MNNIDFIKEALENKSITESQALDILYNLHKRTEEFVDKLIDKYTKEKKLALENCEIMKDKQKYEWYSATFNNLHLYLFDLQDIKCRL